MSREPRMVLSFTLPFELVFNLPPEGPFFGEDRRITNEMHDWLKNLAAELKVCELPRGVGDNPVYWVMLRQQPFEGVSIMQASSQFTWEDCEGSSFEELGVDKFRDSPEDPLICYFAAGMKDWPQGPPIYLSDFRGDGVSARRKLLESISLMFYHTLRHPRS